MLPPVASSLPQQYLPWLIALNGDLTPEISNKRLTRFPLCISMKIVSGFWALLLTERSSLELVQLIDLRNVNM